MAINKWLGTATAVAQVDTFTPANIEATDIFTLTVTGFDGSSSSISYEAVDTSATTVSGALITLWNNQTGSLFTGITASGTSTVILTADTAGVAFKVASSTTDGTGTDTQTFTRAATTANGGPNDWQDANNWSAGTVPGATASEDTYIEDSAVDILYGLDNSGASETLSSIHITRTYTGKIGHNGAAGLIGDYLQLKTSKAFIGEYFESGTASGSGRIKLDFGSTACDVIVYKTATSFDSNKPAFRMIANSASTDVKDIRGGSVGIASQTGETSTIGDVFISYETSPSSDADLEIGSGVTMDNLTCVGGDTSLQCGLAAGGVATSKAGTLIISGSGTIPTLTIAGGDVKSATTGTITACNITSGKCDFTASAEPRTVTTLTLSGGTVQYDRDIVTITSKVEPVTGTGRIQYSASKI